MRSLVAGIAAVALASSAFAADAPFSVRIIPSTGRTVTAEIVDLDGDGRVDVWQAVVFGMPPTERRVMRVHFQRVDGSIPEQPDLEHEIRGAASGYDVANVDGAPGSEILLLQPRGVDIVSFSRDGAGRPAVHSRRVSIPEDLTIGAATDERGLDRFAIASFAFGPEPWLIVPGIAETFLLSPTGELRARIDGGARANYFIQPSDGPMLTESDIQIFLDTPRISVGDIDGDGRPDILASTRHELRLFFRRADGSFPHDADRRIALERVSFEDHIRGSGSVRTTARDIDADGLLDLLISITKGGLMNAAANSYVYFNRGSGWDLDHPDRSFESSESLSADYLIDLDGDGQLEIVRMGVPVSVLEFIEIFVQRALDAWLRAYSLAPAVPGEAADATPKPLFEKKLDVKIDFETSRPAGFIPTINFDVNGDGFVDYLGSSDGTRIEVLLGNGKSGFSTMTTQEISTEGQIRSGDIDGDGLPDFILFNARRLDQPLRLVTNRGVLPGTKRRATIEVRSE